MINKNSFRVFFHIELLQFLHNSHVGFRNACILVIIDNYLENRNNLALYVLVSIETHQPAQLFQLVKMSACLFSWWPRGKIRKSTMTRKFDDNFFFVRVNIVVIETPFLFILLHLLKLLIFFSICELVGCSIQNLFHML